MNFPSNVLKCLALSVVAVMATSACAGAIPYANAGTENPNLYSFKASASGDLVAYLVGGGGSYSNELTVLINGSPSAVQGLNNHGAQYGDSLNFGHLNAGDSIVFKMVNVAPGNVGPWYSDKSLNIDGANHVYATDFAGDARVPAGTYVAFEDLPFPGADFNYNDAPFVVTNVTVTAAVPEPLSAGLMLGGLALVGVVSGRRRAR